ncbi:MAG: peptidase M22 [Oscillospiraceae bacterium]|nr:peptidase M22 [Oscillospiraceae bacterium]
MPLFLGLDTSNYTTSAALFNSDDGKMISCKRLLTVKSGEAGLRQSDAVFQHTKQLPEIVKELCAECGGVSEISAVGVSFRPRNTEGSYMPCFLCGEGLADSFSALNNIPVYKTSHQIGHILAALYSSDRLSMINSPFIAFHVSGGTTDCLYCQPDEAELIKAAETATSLDLKAGQLIDRTGIMLGLDFPCGKALEALAEKADKSIKARAVMKNGSCCLSGFENKAQSMLREGESPENTAKYILNAVFSTVYEMTKYARSVYGELPVIYAGGVMSNGYIKGLITEKIRNVYFSAPEFSCDNAAGTALYAYYTYERQFK